MIQKVIAVAVMLLVTTTAFAQEDGDAPVTAKKFGQGNEFFVGVAGSYLFGSLLIDDTMEYYHLGGGIKAFVEYAPVSFFAIGILNDNQFVKTKNYAEFAMINVDLSMRFMIPTQEITPYARMAGGFTRLIHMESASGNSDVDSPPSLEIRQDENGWNVQPTVGLMFRGMNLGIFFEAGYTYTRLLDDQTVTKGDQTVSGRMESHLFMISLGFTGIFTP